MEGIAAGATMTEGLYLGRFATAMDAGAEQLAVALVWETAQAVALDSRGAISRVKQLEYIHP